VTSPLYFKQIEMGPMRNFVYLLGSTESRKTAVVDAAWDIGEILRIAAEDEMEITHAFVTHCHPDHIGGEFSGVHIQGVTELLEQVKSKVVVHKAEADFLSFLTPTDTIKVESGDVIDIGGVSIKILHTPGHTPGSQCFLIGNRLVSGDTLFIGSCGRVDFPGGNAEEMYTSLTHRLMALPDETVLFPGHNYAQQEASTIGEQKKTNPYLQFQSLTQFLAAMGYR
jgi:hydroxyacylglutathione hydrolase